MRILIITMAALVTVSTVRAQNTAPRHIKFGKGRITDFGAVPGAPEPVPGFPRVMPMLRGAGAEVPARPWERPGAAEPKAVIEPKDLPDPERVELQATDWHCGRYFTDEQGRRWVLVDGTPLSVEPPTVGGWIIKSTDGKEAFYTFGGRLFRQCKQIVPKILFENL